MSISMTISLNFANTATYAYVANEGGNSSSKKIKEFYDGIETINAAPQGFTRIRAVKDFYALDQYDIIGEMCPSSHSQEIQRVEITS